MPFKNIPLTKEDFENTKWQEVITSAEQKDCLYYWQLFFEKANEAEKREDEKERELFLLLGAVTQMIFDLDKPEVFQALFVINNQRGAVPEDIPSEHLNTLGEILETIADAELKARIGDILWLRKRNYKAAISAVRAYLISAKGFEDTEHKYHYISQRVERAFQLAKTLKNGELIEECITYIEDLLERHSREPYILSVLAHFLMEILYKNKIGDPNIYAELSAKVAKAHEAEKQWHLAREYWELKAQWHTLEKNETESQKALLLSVDTYLREAEDAANDNPSRHLAALSFVEDAIELLRRIGGQKLKIEELKKLLISYGEKSLEEMGEISFKVDLSDIAQRARVKVEGKNLTDALFILSLIVHPPVKAELKQEAEESIEAHPIQFRVRHTTLNDMGKTTMRRGSIDEDESDKIIKSEMLKVATNQRNIYSVGIIEPAVRQINKEHAIRSADLMAILSNNPFVPLGREEIYARGLCAGFTGDYLLAAHFLIPQLEHSIRYLLSTNGIITSGLDKDLIQDEYPLNEILYRYREELEQILGEDTVFDLQGLLIERSGANLRNLFAHGLLSHEDFSSPQIIYIWWITLRLCCLPLILASQQNSAK